LLKLLKVNFYVTYNLLKHVASLTIFLTISFSNKSFLDTSVFTAIFLGKTCNGAQNTECLLVIGEHIVNSIKRG
jgi:hypothetical protein